MSLYYTEYTECDDKFFKILSDDGFTSLFKWDSKYKFIRLDLKNKTVDGADISDFKYKNYYKDYSYITNQDLLKLIQPSIMNKKIAIKVETPELSRIIQEFLFTKGLKWSNKGELVQFTDRPYLFPNHFGDKYITYCHHSIDFPVLSAATQFGEIVAMFSEPPKSVIKVKNDAGAEYEAVFSEKGFVTFGCAKIDNKVFIALNGLRGTPVSLNSKTIEQIKIGRGLFTPEVIGQIVAHPDFNK